MQIQVALFPFSFAIQLDELQGEFSLFIGRWYNLKGFIQPCPQIPMSKEIHTEQGDQIGKRPVES
jgi:hypothetical protein